MILHVGQSEMATRLQHDADSLASAIEIGSGQGIVVDFARVGLVYGRPGSGHYAVVRSGPSRVVSASFGTAPPFGIPAAPAGAAEWTSRVDGPFGQPLLVLVRRLRPGSGPVEIAVGEDLTALHEQLLEFRLLFLAASVVILMATLALQGREVQRALWSVEQARDAILRLLRGHALVVPADAPQEIRPLLDEIDRLMRFVERRLHQSRTAIGNLSHAIKTPLAGLLRLVDEPVIAAHGPLHRALREQIETIRLRVERELGRARIAGEHRSGPGFDPHAELPALVETLRRIHRDKTLDIRWHAPGRVLPFDREDLLEVLGNLADNACKWASSRVQVDIDDTDGLCITVADDGPGCPAALRESLGSRGLRADETQPGHGLGLAIVRDIAEAAGGSLRLGVSAALGGLEARVRLPSR